MPNREHEITDLAVKMVNDMDRVGEILVNFRELAGLSIRDVTRSPELDDQLEEWPDVTRKFLTDRQWADLERGKPIPLGPGARLTTSKVLELVEVMESIASRQASEDSEGGTDG